MRKTLILAGKAAVLTVAVFFVYLVSLAFRQEHIPASWIEGAVASVAPTNLVFHCESASFGFRQGLRLSGVKVYDLARSNSLESAASAEVVSVRPLRRLVRIVGAKFPRLHDSYYDLNSFPEPLGDGKIGFSFPRLPEIRLVLERPEILGVAPERVTARVRMRPRRLDFESIRLEWRDCDRKMGLDGSCGIDLDAKRVRGSVRGLATQGQIRPMIVALDVPVALPYMDGFTGVSQPVPAGCSWDVDLSDCSFVLDLDLHPLLGRYNGVPMDRADGTISLHVTFPGQRMDYETRIGPVSARDKKGRRLDGQITVRGEAGAVTLHFDGSSDLPLKDVLAVIDYLNDGTLDCLRCDEPPSVSVKGVLAAETGRQAVNDLRGHVGFSSGSLFGVRMKDARSDFAYVGDTVSFTNASARGPHGGRAEGFAAISVPGLDPERSTFRLDIRYEGGTMDELEDALSTDFGDRHGKVAGRVWLNGPVSTNLLPRLCGGGVVKVSGGRLAQMKLFMGLTELLAREVPGVDRVVNQSDGSCEFSISNGVFRSDRIGVEGAVFSITGKGAYDMVRDNLDFLVRVQLMRDDSVLGRYLIRPITWPFSKLLMEFHVGGKIDAPEWKYISVLDRML